MADQQHLFKRGGIFYWRRALPTTPQARGLYFKGEVALSLKTPERTRASAVGRTLSTVFDEWMGRFRMLQELEKIEPAQFRHLLGWALQDIRDVYLSRIAEPEAIPASSREKILLRLRAEAVVIHAAIRSTDFAAVEGFAAEALRRRGVA
jgi:hypothetical protein